MTTDNRTNEEERQMERCEHFIVTDDFGEGSVYEWCLNCEYEDIRYD